MKFLYISSFCLLFYVMASCSNKQVTFYHSEDEILEGCTVINISDIKDSSVIACSDIFSEVEYIPLEDTFNSTVGMIEKLAVTPDGDMIVFDRRNGIIVRYNRDGHYMNKIGERGHQKNEYVRPIDIAYDPYNKQVIVWDNVRKALLYYDIKGNLVNKKESEQWHGTLEVLDSNSIAVCKSYEIKDRPYSFKYFIMDRNGKIKKEFDEYNTITEFQRSSNRIFSKCDGKLLCHTEYSSNIFELRSDSLVPRYHLSFGKNGIPEDWFGYNEDKFRKMLHRNKNTTYCTRFFEAKRCFVTTICRDFLYLCIKDKEEYGGKVHAGYNLRNDLCGIKVIDEAGGIMNMPTVLPLTVDNGICYFEVEPSLFATFTANLKNIKKQLESNRQYKGEGIDDKDIRKFELLSENNNPIIVKCTLQ